MLQFIDALFFFLAGATIGFCVAQTVNDVTPDEEIKNHEP